MEILHTFLQPGAWFALLSLIFLEIVLGIDNLVFISVVSSRVRPEYRKRTRMVGLLLAMLARIALLFGVSVLMQLTAPLFSFSFSNFSGAVSGQGVIVFSGGLFLLYKSVTEVHRKLEGDGHTKGTRGTGSRFWGVIVQIVLLDMIFSFDSVLTAIGMVSFRDFGYGGAMAIMVAAIVLAVLMMLWFSGPVSKFVNDHPTIQMLALAFLILIGVMLLVEAAHLSHVVLFGKAIGEIPKGYIYFAIAFSLLVETLNMRLSKQARKNRKSNKAATI